MNPNQNNSIAEHIALSQLKEMPIFEKVGQIDFQRILSLMQEPVRAIDTIMGKEQARKVAKQLLIQNLTLQTTVRNLQIEAQNAAQEFEECFEELEKALRGKDIELSDILGEIAEKQDAEALGAGIPEGATHLDEKANVYVCLENDGCVNVFEDGRWVGTEPSNEWVASLKKLDQRPTVNKVD